jgi:flagellar FliL protein
MAKEEQSQQDSAAVTKQKKGPFMKWLIIGVAGVIVIGGCIAGGFFYFKHAGSGKEHQKSEKASTGMMWAMDPFIVNLADNSSERYLKVAMQFEVAGQKDPKALDELKPKLRDSILDILTAKSSGELMDINGKQRLRDDIVIKLNSLLSTGKVKRVYFTEFVIQ